MGINLKDSLVGHVILWTKGWYHERNQPKTIERLNEVINSITGMPEENQVGVRELLGYLMEAAQVLQVNPREIAEAIARETAFTNKRMTSYHTQLQDTIAMNTLITTYAGLVACGKINDGSIPIVFLPELNETMRKKYNLERFINHDI